MENGTPFPMLLYNEPDMVMRGAVAKRMSAVAKVGQSGQKPSRATALLVALGFVVVVFFLVTYGQQLLLEHSLKDKATAQRSANSALTDENTRLKASLQYYQSDKYIEQRAREDLNLRRPDEQIIVPIRTTPDTAAAQAQAVETPVSVPPNSLGSEEDLPNWQKWLNLFAPGQ